MSFFCPLLPGFSSAGLLNCTHFCSSAWMVCFCWLDIMEVRITDSLADITAPLSLNQYEKETVTEIKGLDTPAQIDTSLFPS